MKKFLSLYGLLAALLTAASNPIEARMGERLDSVRAVIISPQSAFTSAHTSAGAGAVVLTKNGVPYTPLNLGWVRWTDRAGILREDAEQNYTVTLRTVFPEGSDGAYLTPSRQFPLEAIEPVAQAAVGSRVLITSRRLGRTVQAAVTAVSEAQHLIATDYPAQGGTAVLPGDSGSWVSDLNGTFVGFVSAQIVDTSGTSVGSRIIVPDMPKLLPGASFSPGRADPVPAAIPVPTNPTAPAPPPVVVELPSEAYARGLADGARAPKAALTSLQRDLEALLVRVKSAQ